MSDKIKSFLFISVVVFVVGGCGCLILYVRNKNFENRCIIESPRVVVSGRITHSDGFFESGPDIYYLYYKGKTRKSHEECRARISVTEREYERVMYKE